MRESFLRKSTALVFLALVGFLLSCQDTDSLIRQRRSRSDRQSTMTVRTTENQDVYGRYRKGDYEGEACEDEDDREECEKQCKEMYKNHKGLCENAPAELISKMHDMFQQMQHFSERSGDLQRQLDDFLFGVMIDIHVEPVLRLVKREWSKREIGKFLIWVAENHLVALALKNHDVSSQILNAAFKKLEVSNVSRAREEKLAVNIGADLDGFFKTFLFLAEARESDFKNEAAFIIIHNLVKQECSSRECKLRVYCLREEYEPGIRAVNQDCPYRERKYFGSLESRHCYVHGPNVWNYWNDLNRSKEFDDPELDGEFQLSEKKCNDICKDIDCSRNKK